MSNTKIVSKIRPFTAAALITLLCTGLGPADAQDIFINRYKYKEGEVPTLYVSPGTTEKLESTVSRNYRKDRLNLSRNIKNTAEMAEIYQAWEKSPRQPKTLEEIESYAYSQRATSELAIQKREKKLIAALEKRDLYQAMRTPSGSSKQKSGTSGEPGSSVSSYSTIHKTEQVPIYVQPGTGSSGQKKSGVFTDW